MINESSNAEFVDLTTSSVNDEQKIYDDDDNDDKLGQGQQQQQIIEETMIDSEIYSIIEDIIQQIDELKVSLIND